MKTEDTDWLVYHLIPENEPVAEEVLAERCGLDPETVAASLVRLDNACLINRCDGKVRMLTFGEALVRNQFRHEPDLPYVIENGVIKARKP